MKLKIQIPQCKEIMVKHATCAQYNNTNSIVDFIIKYKVTCAENIPS